MLQACRAEVNQQADIEARSGEVRDHLLHMRCLNLFHSSNPFHPFNPLTKYI
jgi:hypothetical protein